jgi:hypothetical protein
MPTEISGSTGVNKITDGTVVTADIAADAVDGTKIADNAIGSEHLEDDTVGIAELSATGTASSSTFLRGDNSWAAAGGGAWELVASVTSTANSTVTIGGDSSPIFSSAHDTYVLTGIIKSNQSSSTGMQLQPILAGAGTTADATDNVQHIAPLMRSNQANGSTALTFTHQDILTSYNVDFNYNPMGSGTGMAHAFNMWLYDPFQNASFAHYQLANATVASYDSNSYTSNLNYAYKKATTTAYVGLKLTNVAAGGLDYNLRLYGIKNS